MLKGNKMNFCIRYHIKYLFTVTVLLLFLFPSAESECSSFSGEEKTRLNPDNHDFSVYIQAGYMTGEANEYVVDGDRLISQLIWKIDSLYMAGIGMSWQINEGSVLKTDLWLKTADGESTMDDYDWLIDGMEWTHWSHHDDTIVSKAAVFDISYTYTPLEFRDSIFIFRGVAGYKLTDFEWEARGGSFIYSQSSFRDTEGSFPDGELGITYEQIFHTPYFGFEIEIPAGIMFLSSRFTGSFSVFGRAVDQHHLRDLVTTAYFYWGNMVSIDCTAGIKLGPKIVFSGNYNYMNFLNIQGNSAYDQSGTVTVYKDIEKADFESSMLSLSLTYRFGHRRNQ